MDSVEADFFTLLEGLGRTVRERLVPAADSEHLRSELTALSSILRILADQGRSLPLQEEGDREDIAKVLAAAGSDLEPSRRALAELARAEIEQVRPYIDRDLERGLVGILGFGLAGAPAASLRSDLEQPARHDPVELRSRLAEHLRGHGELVELDRATAGYGAETVLCRLDGPSGERRLVVRIQWRDLPIALNSVTVQAAATESAGAAGVNVAAVVDVVEDAAVIGAPFLVSEHVEGFVPTNWSEAGRAFTARLAAAGWQRFLDDLVAIHAAPLDPGASGPPGAAGGAERQRRRVEGFERAYRESELRPDPLIEAVLVRLRDAARDWAGPVLVHGDYRPGNIIYDDDLTPLAVIDWDSTVIGDPHEDLGHLVAWTWREGDLACGLLPEGRLLEEYERRSGLTVDPEALEYYRLQSTFRRYLGFAALARAWLDRGGEVKMARAWMALSRDRAELARLL